MSNSAKHDELIAMLRKELVVPEELDGKLAKLIDTCDRENEEIQRSITALTSTQMTEARKSIRAIENATADVNELRSNTDRMRSVVRNMRSTPSFQYLRKLHVLQKNVKSIVDWTSTLKEVQYANSAKDLQDGRVKEVYDLVKRVKDIERDVSSFGRHHRAQQQVFQPYFEKAEVTVSLLAATTKEIMRSTVNATVDAALSEGSEPPSFTSLKEAIEICGSEAREPRVIDPEGVELMSRDALEPSVDDSVNDYWDENIIKDVVDITRSVPEVIDGMKKLDALYAAIGEVLVPLSAQFPIFTLVLQAFDDNVVRTLTRYAQRDAGVESHNLIEAMKFTAWYTEMAEETGLTETIDVEMYNRLGAKLLAAAIEGMHEHMCQLAKNCAITVSKDDPASLANGQIYTNGPSDLFQIIQQSLASVTNAADDDILIQLGAACGAAIEAYNEEVVQLSSIEQWEDRFDETNRPRAEWMEMRLLMLCGYCNDVESIRTGIESVQHTFDRLIVGCEPLFVEVEDKLSEVTLYFLQQIVEIMHETVQPAWDKMFGKGGIKDWFNEHTSPLLTVVATLEEYLKRDMATYLDELAVKRLQREVLTASTSHYIEGAVVAIRETRDKNFASEEWSKCISRDASYWSKSWEGLVESSSRAVSVASGALFVLKSLLMVREPSDFTMLLTREILDDFGDFPTSVFQMIFDKRRDLNKSEREALMSAWRDRISFQKRSKEDIPTVGWSQGTSYFGALNESSALKSAKRGMFSRLMRRDPEKQKVKQEEKAKEERRRKRREQREKAATSSSPTTRNRQGQGNQEVEVETLADVLGK